MSSSFTQKFAAFVRTIAIVAAIGNAAQAYVLPAVHFPPAGKNGLSEAELGYLAHVLETDGIVAMTDIPGFAEARKECLTAIGRCYADGRLSEEDTMAVELADGTKRLTLASKSTKDVKDYGCPGLESKMFRLRIIVDKVAAVFAKALDESVLKKEERPLLMAVNNAERVSYENFESVVDKGDHLDHFHVYEKTSKSVPHKDALEKHTDQGLFVAIVPSMSFRDGKPVLSAEEDAFEVELPLPKGLTKISIPNDGDSIVFMLGDGMSTFLSGRSVRALRPVPHRLVMERLDIHRVWFGRMFFPPKDAYMTKHKTTFEKVRVASIESATMSTARSLSFTGCSSNSFRSLVDVAGTCNGQNEIYCWMACRPTDGLSCGVGQTIQCIQGSTGNLWTTENEHCYDCTPMCYSASNNTGGIAKSTSPVCNTNLYATNMYMDGFNGVDPNRACLVFLFQTWVMDTPVKYAFGSIGSFAIGMFIELVILIRRELKKGRSARKYRLLQKIADAVSHPKLHSFLLIFLYGLQLVFAYFAMLLAMSFAAVIFSMVMLGFIAGHFLFNFETAAGGNEACCAANETYEDASQKVRPGDDCCSPNSNSSDGHVSQIHTAQAV